MTETSYVSIRFDNQTGIGYLELNRPDKLNAIDLPMANAFLAAVRELVSKPNLRCIVLSGAGRAFAAGGDVACFAPPNNPAEQINALLDPLHAAIIALRQCQAPVITAVKGVAAGAGFSLAIAGDLVLAEENAKFIIAYTGLGATPDCGASWFLPRRVGRARAMEILLSDPVIDAQAAKEWGIVNKVLASENFESLVEECVLRIASGPTQAYGACKALIDSEVSLAQHLEDERSYFIATSQTGDFREGVSAFLAKRKPVFKGR